MGTKHPGYPDAFKRAVRDTWASGEFATDQEVCDTFGISRTALRTWEDKHEPDGIPWADVRDEIARASVDIVARELSESRADMTLRQLKIVRALQQSALRFVAGSTYDLADGTTLTLPTPQPTSFGEVVNGLLNLIKLERTVRGEPDLRAEYLQKLGVAVRHAIEVFASQAELDDEQQRLFITTFDEQLKVVLEDEL